MLTLASYSLIVAAGALVASALAGIAIRAPARQPVAVGAAGSVAPTGRGRKSSRLALVFGLGGELTLTLTIAVRTAVLGRLPFASLEEFALLFAWGVVGAATLFAWRYELPILGALLLPIVMPLLWFGYTSLAIVEPVGPSLQNSLLLTVHVVTAIAAYATFAVAGAAAILVIASGRRGASPERLAMLDDLAQRAVSLGFPLMTLVILLGAVWAEVVWGTYWSWDPKETASLLTWLIYGAYLHTRLARGWRGAGSAVLLVGGFAAVLLTYFGSLFFGGLHAY
jgi:ABC-type transport system involved in cytochrome c biogenesis permease subunit